MNFIKNNNADNLDIRVYTYFSVNVNDLSINEMEWIDERLERVELSFIPPEIDIEDQNIRDIRDFSSYDDYIFPDFEIKRVGNEYVFFSGSNGSHKQVARLLHEFLAKFNKSNIIRFKWIKWCNSSFDNDDGGVYIIDSNMIKTFTLSELMF